MSYKITRQQALERAPLLKAWGEGAKLQYRHSNRTLWTDCSEYGDILSDTSPGIEYRIKPTPTLRPWRPEEVPVGALLKSDNMLPTLIMSTYIDKVLQKPCISFIRYNSYMDRLDVDRMFCTDLLTNIYHCVHSVDHGKTWLPCGVTE